MTKRERKNVVNTVRYFKNRYGSERAEAVYRSIAREYRFSPLVYVKYGEEDVVKGIVLCDNRGTGHVYNI